jgi:hypothetical protein
MPGPTISHAARFALCRFEASIQFVQHIDEIVGIVGLALVAAYFRPHGVHSAWELPGTAWLFLTIGTGVTMGTLIVGIVGLNELVMPVVLRWGLIRAGEARAPAPSPDGSVAKAEPH